jgi:hypothetical protein
MPIPERANQLQNESPMTKQDDQNRAQRRSLIALGIVIALFVVGWLLARELYADSKLEDCLMSGRTNCQPIQTPQH